MVGGGLPTLPFPPYAALSERRGLRRQLRAGKRAPESEELGLLPGLATSGPGDLRQVPL